MKRTMIATTIALAAFGCTTSRHMMMSPDETIAARQRLMKDNGANLKDIQEKAKAGNAEAIAVNAENLALNSMRITELFPKGTLNPDKSAAKPEIWEKWSEFQAAAKKLQAESEKLRDIAKTKDAGATQAALKTFGKEACGSCHTPFRVPPKKN